jgi:hypothetical protein
VDEETAALMLTNPSTLGVFESQIHKIADILHAKGALLYMDGANMNALVGKVRPGDFGVDVMHLNLHKTFSTPHGGGGPGSGPVACKAFLEPFLPIPVLVLTRTGRRTACPDAGDWEDTNAEPTADGCPPVSRSNSLTQAGRRAVGDTEPLPLHDRRPLHWDYDRPQSVGRVRAFYGNTGMFIRALAYILANGPDGLRQTTEDAVLNANYIRKLEDLYELPYKTASMHEVVFSDKRQAPSGVKTGDIAKRLIDYGFHPYTVSFPLIVHGALMIEPTESESREELDLFIDAMRSIAREVEETPELVKTAPHSTRVSRLDEVQAARKPILRWRHIPRRACWLHSISEWPALLSLAASGLSRTPGALAHRLPARGPRAHLLDGVSARAGGWRHARDAHGGSGPRPLPPELTPRPRSTICAGWESAGRRAPTRAVPYAPYVQSKRRASTSSVAQAAAHRSPVPCRCSRKDLDSALAAPHERAQPRAEAASSTFSTMSPCTPAPAAF